MKNHLLKRKVRSGQHSYGERYGIRAVERALSVLQLLLTTDGTVSLSEIGRRLGLDPSTTFRMLVTLQAKGFVEHDPVSGKYSLGVTCLELGERFSKDNDIRKRALPVLESLLDKFGETVHLTILDGSEVVYLEKLAGRHPIGLMASRIGSRAPAHCTGVGKILLAYLPEEELSKRYPQGKLTRYTEHTITDWKAMRKELAQIRAQGFAIDQQEHEMGVKCVAVPIFDHEAVASGMSIAGPIDRIDRHISEEKLIERLLQAARDLSAQMGGKQPAAFG